MLLCIYCVSYVDTDIIKFTTKSSLALLPYLLNQNGRHEADPGVSDGLVPQQDENDARESLIVDKQYDQCHRVRDEANDRTQQLNIVEDLRINI